MNAAATLYTPQAAGHVGLKTDRDNEYEAFARVTRQLQRAIATDSPADKALAAHDNTRLWSVLAADLSSDDNLLPEKLKAELLSLAIFSIRHASRVQQGLADPRALVDINRAIMRGLRGGEG